MANTSPDGIYYPDSNTLMNFDAILATMASSIQNGIGKRLALQEVAVGLKAGVNPGTGIPTNLPSGLDPTVPFIIRSGDGNFNQGFTLNAGMAQVSVAGMYLVTATLGIQPKSPADRTAAIEIYKNATSLNAAEVIQSTSYYQTALATCVVNCVPGDTISARWHSAGPNFDVGPAVMAAKTSLTSLSIAMVQAIPVA